MEMLKDYWGVSDIDELVPLEFQEPGPYPLRILNRLVLLCLHGVSRRSTCVAVGPRT